MKKKTISYILLFIFFLSGFSSLIYQVSWQRILTLYYSVENISSTLIVSVYMLGLGIGAIIGGHLSERIKNKFNFYIAIELFIGLFGFFSIPFLEFLGKNTAGTNYQVSFIFMFLFLSIPTILMGITLPLLTKIFNRINEDFIFSLSYLYFVNTLGAAFGTIISSFVIISFFGLDNSVYVAAIINLIIALILFGTKYSNTSSLISKNEVAEKVNTTISKPEFTSIKTVHIIVFITGFIAISFEIIWFRIIGVLIKASPYAFSSVLFVFLLGIAIGSYYMKSKLRKVKTINKRNTFFLLQFIISLFVLLSIGLFYVLVKNNTIVTQLLSLSFSQEFHPFVTMPNATSFTAFIKSLFVSLDVLFWPIVFIFFPAILMGASFPLITSLAYSNGKEGYTVGTIYFYNVLGNVCGGLLTGLVLLTYVGSENSILILSAIGLLFIFFIKSKRKIFSLSSKIACVLLILAFIIIYYPRNNNLYLALHPKFIYNKADSIRINESIDGVIVSYSNNEKLKTYINGMSHGGRPIPIFYYEAIEALSSVKEIKNVLVIGFGTGSTTETILSYEPKPKITLVELSKTLIDNLSIVKSTNNLLTDKNLNLVIADGRKFLYNSKDKYDLILIDPLRSYTAYSNNVYSKQFFELLKNHLNPKGVFMIWVDEHHVIPKTLANVFTNIKQFKFFCLASEYNFKTDQNTKSFLFSKFPTIRRKLEKIDSIETKQLTRSEILALTKNFPINEDYKPFCEYFIGIHLLKNK